VTHRVYVRELQRLIDWNAEQLGVIAEMARSCWLVYLVLRLTSQVRAKLLRRRTLPDQFGEE
jgi:hypothetical protein